MKLDKLKDYIPKVEDNSSEIYKNATAKKKRFSFYIPVRVVSLATLVLIISLCILLIPNWNKNNSENKEETFETPAATEEFLPTDEMTDSTPEEDIPSLDHEMPENGYQSIMLKSAVDSLDLTNYKIYTEYKKDEEANAFLEKLENFSIKVALEIYKDCEDNYLVSPVSIYMALAMVVECANGETRDEILEVVGVTYDEVKTFTKYIYGLANRKYYDNNKKELVAFEELANSIWIEQSIDLKQACLEALSEYYHTDTFHAPFKASPKHASELLRKYFLDKTHDLIDLTLEISPYTLFMLINTYYITDIWTKDGSDLLLTEEEYEFYNNDSTVDSVKLLMGEYTGGQVYESENYYHYIQKSNHGYRMKFIIPKDGYSVDDIFTYDTLKTVNNIDDYNSIDFENCLIHYTRVLFPKFSVGSSMNIASSLQNMGIKKMFDGGDFSNIVYEKSSVDRIIHETKLNVDARGFEGAAVTIVESTGESVGPGDYEFVFNDFVVNKEFAFILTSKEDIILFTGVIKNLE